MFFMNTSSTAWRVDAWGFLMHYVGLTQFRMKR